MSHIPELHRPLALDRIGGTPLDQTVTATAGECAALAARLAIPAVTAFECRFTLRRTEGGRIAAEGRLTARLVRECVVTLDAFPAKVTEPFRVVFVPAGQENDDPDPEADDEIPYDGSMLDLGEAAAEQLALTLDPYPHSPGAILPKVAAEEDAASPFAALARRREDG